MNRKTKLIHEIARASGVSLATAYRAVTSPETVAEDTRRRVLQMMQERNISISKRPRSMRRHQPETRKRRVAFLVPQMPFRTVELISEEMAHGIQQVFSQRGVELALHHYAWDGDPAAAVSSTLGDEAVDGILLRPPANRALLEQFCRNRKAVLLGNSFPDLNIPSVLVDDDAGIRMVMDYLFELGHRRIAFVSLSPKMTIYRRRLDAYVTSLYQRRIPLDERLIKLHDGWVVPADETTAIYERFTAELLSATPAPTAIVCTSDSFAAGLMAAARARGIRVPQDLSVTGYGDQYFAALTDPPLTTVHVDQRAMGEVAAGQLLQMLDGTGFPSLTLIRPKFVERRSCALATKG
jgi:DNA-binding LacI/PurR family transcriptional regulator